MLDVVVLGSAAGGGFPQWNSNTPACRRARSRDPDALPRSQTSIAVSANGDDWFILNASPDLRLQIEATPALHPRDGLRSSPIAGVVVPGGDIDAVAGLLHLRERHRFAIYAPQRVLAVIPRTRSSASSHRIASSAPNYPLIGGSSLPGPRGLLGLRSSHMRCHQKCRSISKPRGTIRGSPKKGMRSALRLSRPGPGDLFFIPGCAAITEPVSRRLRAGELVFFDGTLWRDDEMIRLGVGEKTGRRMGHISMAARTARSPLSVIWA